MGYSIQYAPNLNRRYKTFKPIRINKKALIIMTCIFTATFALLISNVRTYLWELIIPGEAEITVSAFGEMLHEIEQGKSISKSLNTFCKEILVNA